MEALWDLHLLRPWWLLALLPCAWLYWRLRRLDGGHRGWQQVIDADLLPYLLSAEGETGRRLPLWMLACWWLLLVLALAGPSWEKIPQPVFSKRDALVVLLDLSPSMGAEDVAPSRWQRGQRKLLDLLKLRSEGSTGLIAYAGDAHVVSPLTDDVRTIANLLPALSPQLMPVPGSNVPAAVALATELMQAAGEPAGNLLLLTDGVHRDQAAEVVELLQGSGYRLSVIGIGSEDGAPVPLADGSLLRDERGAIVVAALERASLLQLARGARGDYRDLSLDDSDLYALLPNLDYASAAVAVDAAERERSADTWRDEGYWLVLLCLPLALAGFRRNWVVGLVLLTVLPSTEVQARDWQDWWRNRDQRAQQLLEAGEAAAAANLFRNPDWSAAAHYRAGQYEQAEQRYAQSDSARSWYNRGNALAHGGELEAAISAYGEALQRQPDLEDAVHNKRLLEQLLQRQQESQQGSKGPQGEQSEAAPAQQGARPEPAGSQAQSGQDQPGQDQPGQQQSAPGEPADHEPQQAAPRPQPPGEAADELEQAAAPAQPEGEAAPAEQRAATSREQEQRREQATLQWLRRVPDDPAGLLRRKFEYESRNRQRQASESVDDW